MHSFPPPRRAVARARDFIIPRALRLSFVPVFTALTPWSVHAADSADDAPVTLLDTTRVTSQTPPTASAVPPDTPAATYGIDAAQLDGINVVNAEDALKHAPNLAVRKRFIGDNNAIVSVRSTSSRQSSHTLVYADGVLLSNFLGSDFGFPPRWSMVAPEEIERVDVIYGPYSALFPGNSLGATVLIRTHMPTGFQADASVQTFRQSFDLYGTHDSFDGHQESAFIGSRSGAWSFLLSVDHLENTSQPLSFYTALRSSAPADAGDIPVSGAVAYRDQLGRPGVVLGVNSEGSTRTIDDQAKLKIAYDITPEVEAAVTAVRWTQSLDNETGSYLHSDDGSRVDSGAVSIDGNHYVLPANAFAPGNGKGERTLASASIRTHRDVGWNVHAIASRFSTGRDIAATANGAGDGPGTVTFGDGSGWRTFDVGADYRPGTLNGAHALTIGYHDDRYALDNITYDTANWQAATRGAFNNAFGGRTQTQAVFAQDAWSFAESWTLIAGVRYEQWQASNGLRVQNATTIAYPEREDHYTSPKLAIAKEFAPGWTARLSLGKAYRLPTVSELFQGRITGTALINNDPDLKAENAFSKDLSVEHAFANGTLRFSLYEDDVRDALFSQTDTTVFPTVTNIQNVDHVRTRGEEIAFHATDAFGPEVDLAASVARNDARTLEDTKNPAAEGKRFYRIPLWRADVMATWRATDWMSATLGANYSGRQYNTLDNSDINPDTFGGTSEILTVDAKLNFHPVDHVEIDVGVDNLANRQAFVYHPYPGRTVYLEAKLSW